MGDVYEYYIWSADEDSDEDLQSRIEEALRDANLEYEFNRLECP
jgi:hypothetical protein